MQELSYKLRQAVCRIRSIAVNHSISYEAVVDLLERDCPGITEEEIGKTLVELILSGITVFPEDEAASLRDGTEFDDPGLFVPASVQNDEWLLTYRDLLIRLQTEGAYGFNLKSRYRSNEITWTPEQRSRFFETIMLKIQTPAFYFDATDLRNGWGVIDGLQRIDAISRMLAFRDRPDSALRESQLEPFTGMQYLKELNGLKFTQIPGNYYRRVLESQVPVYTIYAGTPERIVFNLYQRIRSSGSPMSLPEMRFIRYQGPATELAMKLAKSEAFLKATNGTVPTSNKMDFEYAVHYIAFSESEYRVEYKNDLNGFLNRALKKVNQYSEEQLNDIEAGFYQTMELCHALFGDYAFRLYSENRIRRPVNLKLFELWSICFCNLEPLQVNNIVTNRMKFLHAVQILQQQEDFIEALGGSDLNNLIKRVDLTKRIVNKYAGGNQTPEF